MKTEIHPEYKLVNVVCACGNTFEVRSTAKAIHTRDLRQLPSVLHR